MNIEYQEEIFRFILQVDDVGYFLNYLDSDIFQLGSLKSFCIYLKSYYGKYKHIPNRIILTEYIRKECDFDGIKDDTKQDLYNLIDRLYLPLNNSCEYIRDSLIDKVKVRKLQRLIHDSIDGLDSSSAVDKFTQQVCSINDFGLSQSSLDNSSSGNFFIRDMETFQEQIVHGKPTFLKSLNNMTASNGFKSPEFIIFAAPPKSFKTGILINLAVGYMKDNLKVFYVDTENSKYSILQRIKQTFLKCTISELTLEDNKKKLKDIMEYNKGLEGDIFVQYYPTNTCKVSDVYKEIQQLKTKHNWQPDVIIWDYPDNMLGEFKQRYSDIRGNIQNVYDEIRVLNTKLDCFSIGASQLNRSGYSKYIYDITDLAEDYSKSMKADAIFGLCKSVLDDFGEVMSIVPLKQRSGISYKKNISMPKCYVKIDESRMSMTELIVK